MPPLTWIRSLQSFLLTSRKNEPRTAEGSSEPASTSRPSVVVLASADEADETYEGEKSIAAGETVGAELAEHSSAAIVSNSADLMPVTHEAIVAGSPNVDPTSAEGLLLEKSNSATPTREGKIPESPEMGQTPVSVMMTPV